MAISRITGQDASGGNTNSGTATVSYPGATTVNNLLIAAITSFGNPGQDPSISTAGWTRAVSGGGSGNTQLHGAIYFKVADGTETSVSATNGGVNSIGIGLSIFEYSGAATSSLLDGTPASNSSNTSAVTSWQSPAITTTVAGDLIFYVVNKGILGLGTVTWSSGHTVFGQTGASALEVICGTSIGLTALSNFTDTLSWSGSSQSVSAQIAAFQAAPAGATTTSTSSTSSSTSSSSTSSSISTSTSVSTSTSSTSSSTSVSITTSTSSTSSSESTSLSTSISSTSSSTSRSTSTSSTSQSTSISTSLSTSSTSSSTSTTISTTTSTSSTSGSTSSTSSSTSSTTTIISNDIPVGFIKNQPLTTQPVTSDTTLVDDPVALVDSPTALSNGPVAISEDLRGNSVSTVPRPRVKIER